MKTAIKKVVDKAVRIEWVWPLLDRTLIPVSTYVQISRQRINEEHKQKANADLIRLMFPSVTVLHGVFTGMKYPEMVSVGSTLPPKLLGSYEKEIEPLLEMICENSYTEIVDIGCAEGYYVVGLALRMRNAKVFAFDTNPVALRQCRKMAEINGVSDRLTAEPLCDWKTLKNLPLTERALIVCDCEGFEKQLFNKDNAPALSRHELLIEVHDFLDIEISKYLRELLEGTHGTEVYRSVDDITKVRKYSYYELDGLSLEMKLKVLRECPPAIMEWFYMKPKS